MRDETETNLAVRDELVQLIERGLKLREYLGLESALESAPQEKPAAITPTKKVTEEPPTPRTGVEIVESEKREGTYYHTVRDLRNGNLIKNVTRSSARKLWHYAITQKESGEPKMEKIRCTTIWRFWERASGTTTCGMTWLSGTKAPCTSTMASPIVV